MSTEPEQKEAYIVPKASMDRLVEFCARSNLETWRAKTMIFIWIAIPLLVQIVMSIFLGEIHKNPFPFIMIGFMCILCLVSWSILQGMRGYKYWYKLSKGHFDHLMYMAKARYEIDMMIDN